MPFEAAVCWIFGCRISEKWEMGRVATHMSHGHIDIMGGQSGIRYPIGSIGHLPNDVADDRFRDPKRDGPIGWFWWWTILEPG